MSVAITLGALRMYLSQSPSSGVGKVAVIALSDEPSALLIRHALRHHVDEPQDQGDGREVGRAVLSPPLFGRETLTECRQERSAAAYRDSAWGLLLIALIFACCFVTLAHAESHSDTILARVRRLMDQARTGDLAGSLAELDRVEQDLLPDDAPRVRIAVLEARILALMQAPDGWERASEYLNEAERTAEATTVPELPLLVMLTRVNAANTAQRYDEALAALRRLHAAPALKDFISLRVQVYAYEAVTHHYMGQFEAAKVAGLAGLAEVARDPTSEARTLEARLRANLALTLYRLDEHDEALRNAEAAIHPLEEHRSERVCADALASAYLTRAALRRTPSPDYDEALKLLEQTYGAQSPSLIPALTTKGWAMIEQGALEEASSALERGLALAQRNHLLPFFQLPLMENLASVRLRQHRDDEAKKLAATMRDIWRDWVPFVIDAGSETDRLNLLRQCHWVDTAIAADEESKAVEAIVSSYGMVFDSLLREAALAARLPRDQRLRYRQNQARLAALTVRPGSSASSDEVATLRRLLRDTAGTLTVRMPGPGDLPPGSALVVFAPYRTLDGRPTERLAAAVITDQGQQLIKLAATRDAIRSAGDALAEAIMQPPVNADVARQHLEDLREALLTPLKPALGGATELFLCLDGSMNRVPATLWPRATFLTSPQALLRAAPPQRPLGRSAAWLLVHTAHQRIEFPSKLAFPYSIAQDFKDHALPPLPGAENEITALFEAQPDHWFVLRSQSDEGVFGEPSESTFVQQIADPPAVIHIAGHAALHDPVIETTDNESSWWEGVEQPRVLWSSCLFFADPQPADKAEDLGNDNLLFSAEIAGLDLNGTKLVTLSACETGTGQSSMSEGHYSLARAFHSAGVRDVLSCTEALPDASVVALMAPFYQRLAKGDDAAEAFREEQQRAIGQDVSKIRQYGFFRLTRAWVRVK